MCMWDGPSTMTSRHGREPWSGPTRTRLNVLHLGLWCGTVVSGPTCHFEARGNSASDHEASDSSPFAVLFLFVCTLQSDSRAGLAASIGQSVCPFCSSREQTVQRSLTDLRASLWWEERRFFGSRLRSAQGWLQLFQVFPQTPPCLCLLDGRTLDETKGFSLDQT